MSTGLSNMVTALTGAGMTGSYIFSQTIFSMRAGVKTRIHGIIIAGDARPGIHKAADGCLEKYGMCSFCCTVQFASGRTSSRGMPCGP